jgi:hypothetical protein
MTKTFNWQDFEGVVFETDHPVATTSPDHIMPWGTAHDNSVNPNFNYRMLRLFKNRIGLKC